MPRRLLLSLPVAAGVVIALFWAMSEVVPAGRAHVDYTIQISERSAKIVKQPCDSVPPSVFCPESHVIIDYFPPTLPPPPKVPSALIEPTKIPREPMKPPKTQSPNDLFSQSLLVKRDRCGHAFQPIIRRRSLLSEIVRDGDYAVVEFTIDAEGCPKEIRIMESSNPKIHDYVVRTVQRWQYRPTGKEPRRVRVRIEFDRKGKFGAKRQ